MPRKKKHIIKATVDEEMNRIVKIIKSDIKDGYYEMDWNSFVKAALLLLAAILDNNISPLQFDLFIETHKKEKKKCEA